MSASAASSPGAAAPEGKSMKRRILVWTLLLVLCLGALGGGVAAALGPSTLLNMLTGGEDATPPAAAEDAAEPKGKAGAGDGKAKGAKGTAGMTVMPFKEIIVNITDVTASGRRTTRFLKLNVALIYDEAAPGAANVAARQLYMRDSFQDYLRQLTVRDLQGSIGLVTLKAELLRRARTISGSDAPAEMLVADLIIQ